MADRSPSRPRKIGAASALTVPTLERNIKTIYAVELLRWCLLTSALETAFFENYGMTASQNAFGLLAYSATNTLVELPSGWLADTIGRKKILVASAVLWGLGYMTHCFGSFYWVLVGECVIALGVSASSGSDEALIYETVRELMRLKGSEKTAKGADPDEGEVGAEVTQVLANMGYYRNIASFSGVILGGVVLHVASREAFPYERHECIPACFKEHFSDWGMRAYRYLWLAEGLKYMLVGVLYVSLLDPYMEMGGMAAAVRLLARFGPIFDIIFVLMMGDTYLARADRAGQSEGKGQADEGRGGR